MNRWLLLCLLAGCETIDTGHRAFTTGYMTAAAYTHVTIDDWRMDLAKCQPYLAPGVAVARSSAGRAENAEHQQVTFMLCCDDRDLCVLKTEPVVLKVGE